MDAPTQPSGSHPPGASVEPSVEALVDRDGPLSREQASGLLAAADARIAAGEYAQAARIYQRVVGQRDADITSAALLGLGESLYRLDREADAIETWRTILQLPETPSTYAAWRNIAAARVRAGDLTGARAAYEQADRRAPSEDKAEIASRLGWLAKETGDVRASRRFFARARGGGITAPVTVGLIGVTVAVSLATFTESGASTLLPLLWLDKGAVADGEYWRLFSVTLVHGGLLHLGFNMYALWLAGPIVERFYGALAFLSIYLLCAAAGSVASFLFGGDIPSVGASGAIFGLFGVLLAASRAHDPVVDVRTRSILRQLGPLVLINLVLGFVVAGIDNAAHIGGLLAGLWLGVLMVPGGVPTLIGRDPGGEPPAPWRTSRLLRGAGVLALVIVLLTGLAVGTRQRGGSGPDIPSVTSSTSSPASSGSGFGRV